MAGGDVAQRMAARAWALAWRRWRRRVEVIHTQRMMRPEAYGWRWLYRDLQ